MKRTTATVEGTDREGFRYSPYFVTRSVSKGAGWDIYDLSTGFRIAKWLDFPEAKQRARRLRDDYDELQRNFAAAPVE